MVSVAVEKVTPLEVSVTALGVTESDCADAAPLPELFTARTLNR